jgi:hypothetical protein
MHTSRNNARHDEKGDNMNDRNNYVLTARNAVIESFATEQEDRELASDLIQISGSMIVESDEKGYVAVHVFSLDDSLYYVEVVVVRDIVLRVTIVGSTDF